MLQFIADIQRTFLSGGNPQENFSRLLDGLLEFTSSEYGFIGEIRHTSEDVPYLRTHAITDISWDKASKEFHDKNVNRGLDFLNLDTLFGYCIKTGEVVIANDAPNDKRAGGIPKGHPPLTHFLGLPLLNDGKMVGMAGIANRPKGYDQALLDKIEPLTATIAALIHSHNLATQLNKVVANQNAILNSTLEGICRIDNAGHVTYINDIALNILKRNSSELMGQPLHQLIAQIREDGTTSTWEASALYSTIKSGKTVEIAESQFCTGHGMNLPVEYSTVAIKDGNGQIEGAVLTFKDISKRKSNENQMRVAQAKERYAIKNQQKEMRRLAKLVENSPMGIHEIALDGTFISMNAAGLSMLGVSSESEIKGRHYLDIPGRGYTEQIEELFNKAIKGETCFFCYIAETSSGSTYYSSCFVPIEDEGKIVTVMGITEDITAYKEANDENKMREKQLRAIIDSLPIQVFVKDYHGNYLEANQALADNMSLTIEEVLSTSTHDAHKNDPATANRSVIDDRHVIDTGEEISYIQENYQDGRKKKKHLQIIKRRAPDGTFSQPAVIGNVVDITSLKETELNLRKAMASAEEANKAKSEFLSSVSHELRTPLNAVMGHAQLMQFDDLSDEHKHHTNQIIIAAKKLTQQIDALLFFGKASHQEEKKKELISLSEFFDKLYLQLEPAINEKSLSYSCTMPSDIQLLAADADLEQLFTNIVSNAIKYNRIGGSVDISIIDRTGDTASISIKDTGVGIPPNATEKVFEPFERLNKRNSTIEGTGLGLAIAREAAHRIGASIRFESEEGEGSEFIIDIKLGTQQLPAAKEQQHAG